MSTLEKLRFLQAPADGGAGASGTGGTSATDAGAEQGEKAAGAAGAATGEKTGAGEGEGSKRSFLKGSSAVGDDGAKKDEGKATDGDGAGSKDQSGADEPFDVKVPEGVKLEKADLDRWTKDAKELGLSSEQASKLIAYQDQITKGAVKAQADAWAKQGDTWYGQLEKDAEFGGQNQKASEAAVQKALVRFDPKGELIADLERYGIDNLPSLVKLLRRVGLAGAEDKVDVPKAPTKKDQNTEEARLARRYRSIKGIQPE